MHMFFTRDCMQKCLSVEMTWSFGCHLNLFPPPLPSHTDDFRLYGRSVSQTVSSLPISSNCDKTRLPTKNIIYRVLQSPSFTVACLKSSLWPIYASYEVFFYPAKLGKGLVVFLYSSHTSILFGSPFCSSWSDTTAHTRCFGLFGSFHPLCWNHHFCHPEWYPAFSCSCAWSSARHRTHLQFWELMCRLTYQRHLHDVSHMYGVQQADIILWQWSTRCLSYVWTTANWHYIVAVIYTMSLICMDYSQLTLYCGSDLHDVSHMYGLQLTDIILWQWSTRCLSYVWTTANWHYIVAVIYTMSLICMDYSQLTLYCGSDLHDVSHMYGLQSTDIILWQWSTRCLSYVWTTANWHYIVAVIYTMSLICMDYS